MIKPTMSHAVNKEQLNELLVKYYEKREAELMAYLEMILRLNPDEGLSPESLVNLQSLIRKAL